MSVNGVKSRLGTGNKQDLPGQRSLSCAVCHLHKQPTRSSTFNAIMEEMFADDTKVFRPLRGEKDHQHLQEDIDNLVT